MTNDLTSCFFGHQTCWRSFQCKCKLILVVAYNCWNIFPIYAIVCRCGHANCTFTKKQILPASKLVATPAWRITSSVTDMFKGQDIVGCCLEAYYLSPRMLIWVEMTFFYFFFFSPHLCKIRQSVRMKVKNSKIVYRSITTRLNFIFWLKNTRELAHPVCITNFQNNVKLQKSKWRGSFFSCKVSFLAVYWIIGVPLGPFGYKQLLRCHGNCLHLLPVVKTCAKTSLKYSDYFAATCLIHTDTIEKQVHVSCKTCDVYWSRLNSSFLKYFNFIMIINDYIIQNAKA